MAMTNAVKWNQVITLVILVSAVSEILMFGISEED
jgi:hypothetical protein